MTSNFFRAALCGGVLVTLAACGETSGSVLELVPEPGSDAGRRGPPGSEPRIDVFVVRAVDACAVGEPCRQDDPDTHDGECIVIEEGERTTGFRANSVFFLPPNDPYVASANHVSCFRLVIDDQEMETIERDFTDHFFNALFELSNGEIFAEIIVHQIALLEGALEQYQTESGVFLPPEALDMAPSMASRETDFTYAVTGARDPSTGARPRNEHCVGTVQGIEHGLAGAGYTWLSTECNREKDLLRAFMHQVRVFLPDVNNFNDYYDDNYTDDCNDPTPDPTQWWPSPNDCDEDPDYEHCGDNDCDNDERGFAEHVLTAHWPRGSPYVGNHCNNVREDRHLGEYGVDEGGVCDQLDRPQQTTRR